jgi:hypothetical protein
LCALFKNTKEKFKIHLGISWKFWKKKKKTFSSSSLASGPSAQPATASPRLLLLGPLGLFLEPMAGARGPLFSAPWAEPNIRASAAFSSPLCLSLTPRTHTSGLSSFPRRRQRRFPKITTDQIRAPIFTFRLWSTTGAI